MQQLINGGIYNVNYKGAQSSEFSGKHPSIIVRTLKEDQIYLVVPLTSYTKEKMNKIRKFGSGKKLSSTNSIARIDKMQIMHKRDIKNRWLVNGKALKVTPEEFTELNKKVLEYITLSKQKAEKEYDKYLKAYNNVNRYLRQFVDDEVTQENFFAISTNNGRSKITCNKKDLYWLTNSDIVEITKNLFGVNATIQYDNNLLIIEY
ncbi:type II toxin-antitoxin system PemK/MazF family toxin [Niallia sp. FSL W8-0951]|uniref:type II toxin-antitoxin system PemK/MazF family toxin n=1 Tax=Niallia TaxID=2837506 RepID=UPI0026F27471|nr:type II toxin-antitoxin system PemK/MazF family toxin [Niallia circulans]